MPGHHHHRYQPSRRPQRGATALEFALILPVLLILFYGALTYTLIFAARMGLQHAAEEGARTALSHRIADGSEDDPSPLGLRRAAAAETARNSADWLSRWAEPVIETRICAQDSDCSTETTSCGRTLATACRMQVTVIYPYSERPILPRIAGFGLVTPAQLRGQASVVMDGRLL
jgi:Flp pilus assembly protein TadG